MTDSTIISRVAFLVKYLDSLGAVAAFFTAYDITLKLLLSFLYLIFLLWTFLIILYSHFLHILY